ncbi:hypothetical protein VP01_1050g10 [Puccinia sorghi]|uniref:Uncharacterized protein n=1 Tax=Puccinia sorghi TaxID=27349 RepID=A0A0L6VU92_9BASI|nr:hypothetical protein VP01_1050g10 [Puccinia sorghi]
MSTTSQYNTTYTLLYQCKKQLAPILLRPKSFSISNQAKVFNNFLAFKFKGRNIDQFITNLTGQISNINTVGLIIGIPVDFKMHENILCDSILDRIPSHLVHTWEILLQKKAAQFKTQDSAMKTFSCPSKSLAVKCTNGKHNPEAGYLESQFFTLFL